MWLFENDININVFVKRQKRAYISTFRIEPRLIVNRWPKNAEELDNNITELTESGSTGWFIGFCWYVVVINDFNEVLNEIEDTGWILF